MTQAPNPQKIHPLQNVVRRIAPLLGFLTTAFTLVISLFSTYLVINSAFMIGEIVHLVTLVGALIVFGIQSYLSNFIKNNTLLVRDQKVDFLTLWITTLVICGFVQTLFWVVDSERASHEPRSVFILATVGIVGLLRSQVKGAKLHNPSN